MGARWLASIQRAMRAKRLSPALFALLTSMTVLSLVITTTIRPAEARAAATIYVSVSGSDTTGDGSLTALQTLKDCKPLSRILGEGFTELYRQVKETEYETYFHVISSWEREFLLLNV